MKKLLCTIIICLLTSPTFAGVKLPAKCEVGLPSLFRKMKVKESELDALISSGEWGQNNKLQKYWTVYSDRSNNNTYDIPSEKGIVYDVLYFGEQVRIAKIENDFALVYTESQKGAIYPLISSCARSRGWIPMKNLLLCNSCPTNEFGVYNKAIIVLNIDEAKKGNTDIDKRYQNPVTKESTQKLVADSNIYFVMKKADNGSVLLAKECKMEGYTNSVLYGWVSTSSFIPWSHRICIEPNWTTDFVEKMKGRSLNVYRNDTVVCSFVIGKINKFLSANDSIARKKNRYRWPGERMRFVLLDENETQYHVIVFSSPEVIDTDGLIIPEGRFSSLNIDLMNSCLFYSEEKINNLKECSEDSRIAFEGYVDKQSEGLILWLPVLHISSDEFAQLMERLQPVMLAACTGNRKPYVDALKDLVRLMIPDITPKEMDEIDTKEVMTLVEALPVKPSALKGRTLLEIYDENIVSDDEFNGIIGDFQNKFRRLKKIRENKYDFSFERNKTTWYWIPLEDLP